MAAKSGHSSLISTWHESCNALPNKMRIAKIRD